MENNKNITNSKIEKKRVRRSKNDIEQSIFSATQQLIEETGFRNLTISAIAQRAKIEPPVFYNRYTDINDMLEKFVRAYDYWLNDSVKFDPVNLNLKQNNENLLFGLIDSINSDKIMQQLLVWELTDVNSITRRTAENRERNSRNLIQYFSDSFKDSNIDIKVVSAILISGIYYLAAHKNVSTFCLVDFSTNDGLNRLKKTIQMILDKIYDKSPSKFPANSDMINSTIHAEYRKSMNIARKMLAEKFDVSIIQNITELTDDDMKILLSENESPIQKNVTNTLKKKRGRPPKLNKS